MSVETHVCNGHLEESPDLLQRAISYLEGFGKV